MVDSKVRVGGKHLDSYSIMARAYCFLIFVHVSPGYCLTSDRFLCIYSVALADIITVNYCQLLCCCWFIPDFSTHSSTFSSLQITSIFKYLIISHLQLPTSQSHIFQAMRTPHRIHDSLRYYWSLSLTSQDNEGAPCIIKKRRYHK